MDVRDRKESWALMNWCFWTVVLEKTLESPLDSKEIKLVNCKGNQPWIFIARTAAEAPILWLPDARADSLRPHRMQHDRLPCPSLFPRVFSNSCLLSQWCHTTISSFVTSLLLQPLIFPNIRVFSSELVFPIKWQKDWLFCPSNEYSCMPLWKTKIYSVMCTSV